MEQAPFLCLGDRNGHTSKFGSAFILFFVLSKLWNVSEFLQSEVLCWCHFLWVILFVTITFLIDVGKFPFSHQALCLPLAPLLKGHGVNIPESPVSSATHFHSIESYWSNVSLFFTFVIPTFTSCWPRFCLSLLGCHHFQISSHPISIPASSSCLVFLLHFPLYRLIPSVDYPLLGNVMWIYQLETWEQHTLPSLFAWNTNVQWRIVDGLGKKWYVGHCSWCCVCLIHRELWTNEPELDVTQLTYHENWHLNSVVGGLVLSTSCSSEMCVFLIEQSEDCWCSIGYGSFVQFFVSL